MSTIMHERLCGREVAARICSEVTRLDPYKIYTIILQAPNENEKREFIQTEPLPPKEKWLTEKSVPPDPLAGCLQRYAKEYIPLSTARERLWAAGVQNADSCR